jgi:hypothetical protein
MAIAQLALPPRMQLVCRTHLSPCLAAVANVLRPPQENSCRSSKSSIPRYTHPQL